MIQTLCVAMIVTCAAWFVVRRYLPYVLWVWIQTKAAGLARRVGCVTLARWLEPSLLAASSCTDGCHDCGSGCAVAPLEGGVSATQIEGVHLVDVSQLRRRVTH